MSTEYSFTYLIYQDIVQTHHNTILLNTLYVSFVCEFFIKFFEEKKLSEEGYAFLWRHYLFDQQ
jgi:hypothetical protein